MKFVLTIDTEEDGWGDFHKTEGHTYENLEKIPAIQRLFDEFGVRPTYLITYPVVISPEAVSMLGAILESGRCEIGTHCHPWNTPPYSLPGGPIESMLCNLPSDLQYQKLVTIHEAVRRSFGIQPVSFRAGRWGFSNDVARNILRLGYKVDTSVTPFQSWKAYGGPDFSSLPFRAYRFSADDITASSAPGEMAEIPASIGFRQTNYRRCCALLKISRNGVAGRFHLRGILSRMGIMNRIWLSPEYSDSREMIRLTRSLIRNGVTILNLTFHSQSLKGGLSPFVKDKAGEEEFILRLKGYLQFIRDEGIKPVTLSEAAEAVS